MTKFVFYKRDGVYYGFRESGHTGFGEEGDDILCAALSAMTMLLINAIEVSYASDVEYTIDDDSADITFFARGALDEFEQDEKKRYAVRGAMYAFYLQINDLLEEYYDYIDVSEVEE
ncbi:MAG: ribosomal-processing cysteine protease Prp [Clostridia bacterium]|nr:ribosomal-processing cysteine protease Prp [Clostridia bacterium]